MSRYTKYNSSFAYHAQAIGFSASLYRPTSENIPGQASISLSQTGGESHSVVRDFNWKGIFHFAEASAYVTGSSDADQRVYSTLSTVTVRGLNIANMITADQIIARVSSRHERDKDGNLSEEGTITLEGSTFQNLRVAGRLVHAKVDTRSCSNVSFDKGRELAKLRGGHSSTDSVSFSAACDASAEDLTVENGKIILPEFGTIYLATVIFKHGYRRISMLRAELGCPIGGGVEVCGGEGNGTDIWQ